MRFGSKHKDREKQFSFSGFEGGLNTDVQATSLAVNQLSQCKNMKYMIGKKEDGTPTVVLKTRQGTTKISSAALSGGADIVACTYFIKDAHYIVATTTKVYELDGNLAPVEIGTISGTPTFTEFNEKLIIHDGSTTKAWNGTTFETLTSYYEDVSLGTGDGGTTNYTGSLAGTTVKTSSITITYTSTTTKTITDDGAGNLIGDVNVGGTNTINYANGAYDFTCSAAPDNATDISVSYEKVAGAPKSKAGMVRAGRLYMWGDSDNPSRLWYSAVNDEDAWGNSTNGGYLDVDSKDGYSLVGVLNYFQSLVLFKGNSIHRLDNFPGDSEFRVEPLVNGIGALAYRTVLSDGDIITFLSPSAWLAMSPSERYGDIQKMTPISASFSEEIANTAVAASYAEHNQIDNQLWLTTSGDIYVINLSTGGQLSKYSFAFTHKSYKYVNGEMLIGGADGHLYKLVDDESIFKDNAVSYSTETYMRTSFTDWGLPLNKKHNKKIFLRISGGRGLTGTLDLYRDQNYGAFDTESLSIGAGGTLIIYNTSDEIYDMQSTYISAIVDVDLRFNKKFNYREVMIGLDDLYGDLGVEVHGVNLRSAIKGD